MNRKRHISRNWCTNFWCGVQTLWTKHCSSEIFMFVTDAPEKNKKWAFEKKYSLNFCISTHHSHPHTLSRWNSVSVRFEHIKTKSSTNIAGHQVPSFSQLHPKKHAPKCLNIYEKWPHQKITSKQSSAVFFGYVLQCPSFYIVICLQCCFNQLYTYSVLRTRCEKMGIFQMKNAIYWLCGRLPLKNSVNGKAILAMMSEVNAN